jgi:hypothetical protein
MHSDWAHLVVFRSSEVVTNEHNGRKKRQRGTKGKLLHSAKWSSESKGYIFMLYQPSENYIKNLQLATCFDRMRSLCESTNIRIRWYIFWDIPCSHLKAKQSFGGICSLHLQCKSVSKRSNHSEVGRKLNFLIGLVSDPEDGGNYIPEEGTLHTHGVTTSNPKYTYIYRHVHECAIDGVWIANGIYWTASMTLSVTHTLYNSLQHALRLLRLLCLHRLSPGNGFQRRAFLSFRVHVLTMWRMSPNWLNSSQSQSHIAIDGQSVSKSWCRALSWGSWSDIYYCLIDTVCSSGAPSLTRGRICLLNMLLALASAVFLGSESLGTRDHISVSQIWDFPFCCLLWLAGSQWRYLTPLPHRWVELSVIVGFLLYSLSSDHSTESATIA